MAPKANTPLQPNYWMFSANEQSEEWENFYNEGIMAVGHDGTGDLNNYNSKQEMQEAIDAHFNDRKRHFQHALCNWQFCNEMNIGDIIFVKRGRHYLIGYGIVKSNYRYDETQKDFRHIRDVEWLANTEIHTYSDLGMKTLTKLKDEEKIGEMCGLLNIERG